MLGAAVGTSAGANAAEARAHPDPTRDVWELAVWDPLPLCLRLFCLFSPGHVLVYWLFLPVSSNGGGSASVTVLTAILLAALLSAQLLLLQASFSQQNKDTALIHKEVLNEYDTKFVHPRTQSTVRDVGTQFDGDPELLLASLDAAGQEAPAQVQDKSGRLHHRRHRQDQQQQQQRRPLNFVHTYTPTTVLHRAFVTHANPNYAKHYDPDGYAEQLARSRHGGHVAAATSAAGVVGGAGAGATTTSAAFQRRAASPYDVSSPLRRVTGSTTSSTKTTTTYATNGTSTGDGGSLGVYSHANSPLRKAAATAAPQSQQNGSGSSSNSRSIPFPLASQYGRPVGTAVSLSSSTPIAPAATKHHHHHHLNRHREGSPLKNSFL